MVLTRSLSVLYPCREVPEQTGLPPVLLWNRWGLCRCDGLIERAVSQLASHLHHCQHHRRCCLRHRHHHPHYRPRKHRCGSKHGNVKRYFKFLDEMSDVFFFLLQPYKTERFKVQMQWMWHLNRCFATPLQRINVNLIVVGKLSHSKKYDIYNWITKTESMYIIKQSYDPYHIAFFFFAVNTRITDPAAVLGPGGESSRESVFKRSRMFCSRLSSSCFLWS